MEKIDLKKELKNLYEPTHKEVTLLDVPKMNFILIDGQGAPESMQFQQSIEALYPIAYTIKFDKKKSGGPDYGVMVLEGLWWAEDMAVFMPDKVDRNKWQWTLMIMQPDFISIEDFEKAKEASRKKKANSAISQVRFQSLKEGKSAQIMHIGPFSEEGPNIERLHEKISQIGGKISGKHHEIYLSDFRRVNPAKMRTVLRQPYEI
jgi:hypothetical protein